MMKRVVVRLAILVLLASGCRPEYEFLKMPRAGLKAGSRWKKGIGVTTDGPPPGVTVTMKSRGLDWLNEETKKKGGARLESVLAGFFAAGLEIDSEKIKSIQAEGLTHQQVVNPEKLAKGYDYLWETVSAAKVKLKLDRSLAASIRGRIDRFKAKGLARKVSLEFKPASLESKSSYEVTGKDLVVAIKVVGFDMKTESQTVTVFLGRDWQDRDQDGPFGYSIAVKSGGVDLPARKAKAIFRNPRFAGSGTGSWERTLTTRGATIHAGPVVGVRCDGAADRFHVAGWDTRDLSCQVTFTRTTWTLKKAGSGLETVK